MNECDLSKMPDEDAEFANQLRQLGAAAAASETAKGSQPLLSEQQMAEMFYRCGWEAALAERGDASGTQLPLQNRLTKWSFPVGAILGTAAGVLLMFVLSSVRRESASMIADVDQSKPLEESSQGPDVTSVPGPVSVDGKLEKRDVSQLAMDETLGDSNGTISFAGQMTSGGALAAWLGLEQPAIFVSLRRADPLVEMLSPVARRKWEMSVDESERTRKQSAIRKRPASLFELKRQLIEEGTLL